MKRVTGIGGIFFKAKEAPSLRAWYKRHLGIDVQAWGGAAFDWTDAEGKPVAGTTAWLIDPQESNHFAPSSAPFMVNYRVEDLHALVKVLKKEGCNVLEKIDESEYGRLAWAIDPEGNKVELWQTPQGQRPADPHRSPPLLSRPRSCENSDMRKWLLAGLAVVAISVAGLSYHVFVARRNAEHYRGLIESQSPAEKHNHYREILRFYDPFDDTRLRARQWVA